MTFLHLSVLAGLALAGVPLVIHMLTRQQPKPMLFPALRFVRETVVVAERGWKVKHWLLLALRALIVGLAALMFASPRVHSAMLATYLSIGLLAILALLATSAALVAYASRRPWTVLLVTAILATALWVGTIAWGAMSIARGSAPPTQNSSGPIAAALVIDTSPTMDYRSSNETRMDAAKAMGKWVMNRFPLESQIAIVTRDQGLRLSQDRVTAERQLERVEIEGKSSALTRRILAAIQLVRTSKLERREVYVLTDLTEGAWREADQSALQTAMAAEPHVLVQLIDVGIDKTQNWKITNLKLSQQVVLPGGSVNLDADVTASRDAPREQLTVELYTEAIDRSLPIQRNGKTITPPATLVDRQIVELEAGQSRRVQFRVSDLTLGTHQISLKLSRPDPLMIDNTVYAAVDVRTQGKVLIVADNEQLGKFLAAVVSPDDVRSDAKETITQRLNYFRLDAESLSQYTCLCLLDPPPLALSTTEKIQAFAEQGGGVLILLGAKQPNEMALKTAPLARLLPGVPARITRRSLGDRTIYFDPVRVNHPVFNVFGQVRDSVSWNQFPIYRHWDFDELAENATVIMRYTGSGKPAVIEQSRGSGKVITFSTPIPEPADPEGRQPWNDLTSGSTSWPSFGLLKGTIEYLSGWGKNQLTYLVGEPVVLENDPAVHPLRYDLFTPNNQVIRRDAGALGISYTDAQFPGSYRLRGLRGETPVVRGFAVNVAADDTILDRMSQEKLDALFGVGNYHVARQRDQVASSIGQARYGRELYPFLLTVVVFLMIAEQAMASRFYSLRFQRSRVKA